MISFTSVETRFVLKNKRKVQNWIKSILETENKKAGNITYVFCSDSYLGQMNEKYLRHHSLTDIITFDYSEKDTLSGDICISVERVRENSEIFKTTFNQELARVMAHGVLHLSGYNDKSAEDKKRMRAKEDFYLSLNPVL